MDLKKIFESLSPHERKILPHIEEKNLIEICKKSNLDKVSVIRSLEYLKDKKLLDISVKKTKVVEIGVNGALYKKKGLPERRLLNLLDEKRILKLEEAKRESGLSEDEFRASIGALKRKALIELKNEKIIFSANKEEISKKSSEEQLIDSLPLDYDSLAPEQLHAFKSLEKRKDIIQVSEKKVIEIEATDTGKKVMRLGMKGSDMIEQITSEMLKKESSWKGKKFRRYNISFPSPSVSGGKRHFVNQATDYARSIWTQMGFKEMSGDLVQSSFWNFDALFTAQDHPVREMQDTFFIPKKIQKEKDIIPGKELVKNVKKAHEKGIDGSGGWNYEWNEEESKRLVLRTHTTCLSAQTLYELSKLPPEKRYGKFFAVGKVFRNETVDWSHSFEFNQTEGIVVGKELNLKHLLGYLKQFYKKMGFEKVRFRPGYFPYTEPSVEIDVWHPERKVWLELGGAGIFRPELTEPILGKGYEVLAWGLGFDRIITDFYKIKDLRELYKNDLTKLRKMRFWLK
ncbi:MAG TPA: phenylalanine--tRNA ligase subunit alpha [Candidatus Pacearchaeota archaeon]|nr:phenylalanine--tRNA ligase subunit alpha [Candidatus Pacearchaeota archaeon]